MTKKEKTAKIWEHKVDIYVNIVNIVIIVHFVKTSSNKLKIPPAGSDGKAVYNTFVAQNLVFKVLCSEDRGSRLHAFLPATLALKPRADVTRSPKQGYQRPHKKDLCPPKLKKKFCVLCFLQQELCNSFNKRRC